MDDSGVAFLAATAARTAVVFVLLLVAIRATGKRQAGELNGHDLLVVLMVANAVQNAMTKGSGSLGVALVSSGTLIGVGWLVALVLSRRPSWQTWAVGEPTVLVEDGRVLRKALKGEGVSEDDLMAAVRDKGLESASGVRLAVLETDGSISVVPRDAGGKG